MAMILGYVRDDLTLAPISEAVVSKNSNYSNYYLTGSNGYYQVNVAPGASYNIYAEKDDQYPQPDHKPAAPYYYPKNLYSINIPDNNPVVRDIYMRRKA